MASQNIAGVKVDDALKFKFLNEAQKTTSPLKCLCMKFEDKGCGKVVLDEENHVLKEEESAIPDLNDYEARLAYEMKLYNNFVGKILNECRNDVRFFTWEFYFKSTSGTCKNKLGLIHWIPDEARGKEKMCAASATAEIELQIGLKPSVEVHDQEELFNYMELVKSLTLNFKN